MLTVILVRSVASDILLFFVTDFYPTSSTEQGHLFISRRSSDEPYFFFLFSYTHTHTQTYIMYTVYMCVRLHMAGVKRSMDPISCTGRPERISCFLEGIPFDVVSILVSRGGYLCCVLCVCVP